jgi:hypothetical protein
MVRAENLSEIVNQKFAELFRRHRRDRFHLIGSRNKAARIPW